MKASIRCVVYGDFKYDNEDCEYEKALAGLNEYLIDLVKRGKLSANYKGKEVKIILPISSWNVGNIFEDVSYPYWEGVELPCEIEGVGDEEFMARKLRFGKHPNGIRQYGVCW